MSDEEDYKGGEGGATAFFPFEETTRKSKETSSSHHKNPCVPGLPSLLSSQKSSLAWAVDRSREHQTPPSFHTHTGLRSAKELQGATEQLRFSRCLVQMDTGRHPAIAQRG